MIEGIVDADEPFGKGVDRFDSRAHRLAVAVPRLDLALDEYAVRFGINVTRRQTSGESRIERGETEIDLQTLGDVPFDEALDGQQGLHRFRHIAVEFLFGQFAGEFLVRQLAAKLQMGLKTASGPVRRGDSTRDDIQLYAVKIRFGLAHKVLRQGVNTNWRQYSIQLAAIQWRTAACLNLNCRQLGMLHRRG